MQTTKRGILSHLKRTGGGTVDGLATTLGLARMTVRQHLAGLERDGLVVSKEERQRRGRPHLLFSLSDSGQELFPKRYDRLAALVLEEVSLLDAEELTGLSPREKKRLLLKKMAERAYQEYEGRVRGKSLRERVAAVAEILQEEGGLAEWRVEEQGFEIVDYNCVYRRVVDSHNDLCEWHLGLLSRLLGHDVQCSQFMSRGAESCRFMVREGTSSQSGAKGEGKER